VASAGGDVSVGGTVSQLKGGSVHTCALLTDGNVRCWGRGTYGRLGYGSQNDVGLTQTPAAAGDINLGGTAAAIGAGGEHTCALLSNGNVRCFGRGLSGRLGYGNTRDIGDNELPSNAGNVPYL